mgnify:CR=1 FL=1
MNYATTIHLIKAFAEKEDLAYLRLSIATSVASNLDLSAYDDEGVNEVCARIEKFLLKAKDWPDFDDFVNTINDLIDNGKYETVNDDCLQSAYDACEAEC